MLFNIIDLDSIVYKCEIGLLRLLMFFLTLWDGLSDIKFRKYM